MIHVIVTVNGHRYSMLSRSTIDAINDARDYFGFGPSISAKAAR